MSQHEFAAIILAAGKGTRMKSALHKVLHPIAGRPMLKHLMASVEALGPKKQVVVVGAGREQVEGALGDTAETCLQEPQLGTGHAVQQAQERLAGFKGDVLVLYGDVPFVRGETMQAMLDRLHEEDAPKVVVLGFEPDDALAYGRVIADNAGDDADPGAALRAAIEARRAKAEARAAAIERGDVAVVDPREQRERELEAQRKKEALAKKKKKAEAKAGKIMSDRL